LLDSQRTSGAIRLRRRSGADSALEQMVRDEVGAHARTSTRQAFDQTFLSYLRWLDEPVRLSDDVHRDWLLRLAREQQGQRYVRYQGLDRVAMREARRFVRRAYKQAVEERFQGWYRDHKTRLVSNYDQAQLDGTQDVAADARFAMKYPAYCSQHASFQAPTRVNQGERIEVLRIGPYTLTNDLRMFRGTRATLIQVDPASRNAAGERNGDVHHEDPGPGPGSRSLILERKRAPDGLLFANDHMDIDAKAHLSISTRKLSVEGRIEVRLYDNLFDSWLGRARLEVDFDPMDQEAQVALMFSLRTF
jgi:hypothetical protein